MPLHEEISTYQSKPPGGGPTTLQIAIFAAALLIILLLVAGFFSSRVQQVEDSVARLQGTFEKVEEKLDQVVESNEQLKGRAQKAELESAIAHQERLAAESEREQARILVDQMTDEVRAAQDRAFDAEQEAARIHAERERELNELQSTLSRIAETRRTALGLVMNLSSDALKFDFDKAVLRPSSRELLSRVAGILLTLPDSYGVYVYGHTDDVGSDRYNQSLSERRAEAVRDYLVEAGILPAQITTEGYGKSRPLVEGTSDEARATNRRVEIGIINTQIRYTGRNASVP